MGTSNARKLKREAARTQLENSTSTDSAPLCSRNDRLAASISVDAEGHHRLDCIPDIVVAKIPGMGRGLLWQPRDGRKVEKGTTLLCLTPHAIVPHEEAILTRCYICFSLEAKDGSALQPCSGCLLVRYCCSQCQEIDEESHKMECIALQKLRRDKASNTPIDPTHTNRLAGRMIWERQRLGQDWWSSFESLEDHLDDSGQNFRMSFMAKAALPYLNGAGHSVSMSDATGVMARVGNGYDMCLSDQSTVVATCMDTIAALINHSCSPNVNISYPEEAKIVNPTRIVAIKTIKPGDELLHCYCRPSYSFRDRQAYLSAGWQFDCRCEVCLKTTSPNCPCDKCIHGNKWSASVLGDKGTSSWIDPRQAQWCGRKGCTGWVRQCPKTQCPVGQCSKCKQPSVFKPIEVSETITNAIKILDQLRRLNLTTEGPEVIQVGAPIVKKLSIIQPPCAQPLYTLIRRVKAAMRNVELETAAAKGKYEVYLEYTQLTMLTVAGMQAGGKRSILPEGNVLRCVFLEELANIFLNLGITIEKGRKQRLTSGDRPSRFGLRMPDVPRGAEQMRMFGINLLKQALEEYKVCFGKELEGGIRGREVKEEIKLWESNQLPAMETLGPKMRSIYHLSIE